MVLHILRALFILLMAAVGWFFIGQISWMTMATALAVGVLFLCIDILAPRAKLTIFAGTFFGLLVGVAIAYALSFVVQLLVEQLVLPSATAIGPELTHFKEFKIALGEYINLLVGVLACYLSISFILQTKDDFR